MRRLDRTLRRGSPAPKSLAARALSAIRRNGGTLLLPGAATPVLGGNDATGPWLNTWAVPLDSFESYSADGFAGGTVSAKTTVRVGVSCGKTVAPGATYLISFVPEFSGASAFQLTFATGVFGGTGGAIGVSLTSGVRFTTLMTVPSLGSASTHLMFLLNTTAGATFAVSEFTNYELTGYTHGNPPLRNYLDSAGTDLLDSVTQVDQPVGLCLDSMGVLGAELFTGSYSTGAATTATYVGNEATATFGGSIPATSNNWLSLPGAATANVYSEIEFWATYVSGGNLEVGRTWTAAQTITAASNAGVRTRYKATVFSSTPSASAGRATFGSTTAGSVWKIEIISVREIPGNHATQQTTANKGILRRTSGRYRWEFDATDTLGVTLPAGFNAATTIDARSTGHVTLQNQNIVGAYSIGPSITSFGRIILPSSPSASDLALLQRYANWLAGVSA